MPDGRMNGVFTAVLWRWSKKKRMLVTWELHRRRWNWTDVMRLRDIAPNAKIVGIEGDVFQATLMFRSMDFDTFSLRAKPT